MTVYQILRNEGNYIYTNVGAYPGKNPDDAIEKMALRGDVYGNHWKKNYIAIPVRSFKHRKIKNT
jgi:hypothetical protein